MNNVQNNLPDLPGLETVELRNWVVLWKAFAAFGFFIITIGLPMLLMSIHYCKYLPNAIIWTGGLCIILVAWIVMRLLSADYYYLSDRTGLTIRGIFRRRHIDWNEIVDAKSSEGFTSDYRIELNLSRGHFVVDPGLRCSGNARLFASIWQYLRQIGKADNLYLSPQALSFWDTIPDELPHEMEWGKKPHIARWLMPILTIACAIGLLIFIWSSSPHNLSSKILFSYVTLLLPIICIVSIHLWAKRAVKVIINSDEIVAQTCLRTIHLLWSDIDYAERTQEGICIGSHKLRKYFLTPILFNKDDSQKMILGIIRRLRTSGTPQLIVIPNTMRSLASSALHSPSGSLESVKLQNSRLDLAAILVMVEFCYAPLCIQIVREISVLWITIPLILAGAILVGLLTAYIARSYKISVSNEGITQSFLNWKKVIQWEDITSCELSPIPKESMRGKRVLKNAKGKVLINFPPGIGSEVDRSKFEAYIEAKLLELGLCQNLAQPWFARPLSTLNQGDNQ